MGKIRLRTNLRKFPVDRVRLRKPHFFETDKAPEGPHDSDSSNATLKSWAKWSIAEFITFDLNGGRTFRLESNNFAIITHYNY